MTFAEAEDSEREARRSLESFPSWWFPYILTAIHYSTEAIELLSSRISTYCRGHLALGEPVRLPFNDELYSGVVSVAPDFGVADGTEMDQSDSAAYRISINDADMIMTAACRGPEDVQYSALYNSLDF
jgi:hypothetical protein